MTVKLTARIRSDPETQLNAVREALRRSNIEMRVLNIPDEAGTVPFASGLPLEQLETAASAAANQELDSRERQANKRPPGSAEAVAWALVGSLGLDEGDHRSRVANHH